MTENREPAEETIEETTRADETVLNEYPQFTQWVDEKKVKGTGNLVLTNRRLLFLHQVVVNEQRRRDAKLLSEKASTQQLIDYALRLDKNNFMFPLLSVAGAKTRINRLLPYPQYSLQVTCYVGPKRELKTYEFLFTVPWLSGLLLKQLATVRGWVKDINSTLQQSVHDYLE